MFMTLLWKFGCYLLMIVISILIETVWSLKIIIVTAKYSSE